MENITDRIQDYIDGLLEGEDLAYFESRMAVDEELRNLVALHREVQRIINGRLDSEEAALRSNLVDARANMSTTPQSRKVFQLYLPVVAAACLLVFFGLFFFKGDGALYELPVMQSEIVRGDTGAAAYEDAVAAFNQGKYSEARHILDDLISEEPAIVQYQYYSALTYIGEEDWPQSIEVLQPLATGRSIYADESKYYLAVAYWKSGENAKAAEVLRQIPETGKLGEKAGKLLKKVE